jgi:RND superfamily putative drug exporter
VPAVLAVILVVLVLLLRALVVPVIILVANLLSFGASIGVAAVVFNHVLGFPGADPSVILYAFVFLVALGIDYTIFLMTRVREETLAFGTRRGVQRGLAVTGGVITSAGIVLAATFGALAVLPILFLAQISFIVAFGVLLDTMIVRSLLVPGVVHDLGRSSWWPFASRVPADADESVEAGVSEVPVPR